MGSNKVPSSFSDCQRPNILLLEVQILAVVKQHFDGRHGRGDDGNEAPVISCVEIKVIIFLSLHFRICF